MALSTNRPMLPMHIAVAITDSRSRAYLTSTLRSDPSLCIIGEASDEAGLLKLASRIRPGVLLLDSALATRINGAASSLLSTRIILLAHNIERDQVVQALQLGARGILPLDSPARVLLESIRAVLADEYCLCANSIEILFTITRALLAERSEQPQNEDHGLTSRELGVISMIADGCSNRQISQTLSISERTVKHHLTNIFSKLGVASRLQLASYAVIHGLVADASCFLGPQYPPKRRGRTGSIAG